MNYDNPRAFYQNLDQGIKVGEPIWQNTEYYDLTFEIHDKNKRQLNLTIPLGNTTDEESYYSQMYTKNKTMYLHFLMYTPDVWSKDFSKDKQYHQQPNKYFRKSIELVKYMAPYKEAEVMNLLDDTPPVKTKE